MKLMMKPIAVEKSFNAFNLSGVIFKNLRLSYSLCSISSRRSGTALTRSLTFVICDSLSTFSMSFVLSPLLMNLQTGLTGKYTLYNWPSLHISILPVFIRIKSIAFHYSWLKVDFFNCLLAISLLSDKACNRI